MTRPHDPTAPFSALVFKVVSDTHGDLTYIRVYSGTLTKGTRVLNPGNGKKENVSRIFEMHANSRNALEEVDAGNIVAVIGLKNSYTGDTICDESHPVVLEAMELRAALAGSAPVVGQGSDELSVPEEGREVVDGDGHADVVDRAVVGKADHPVGRAVAAEQPDVSGAGRRRGVGQ